MSLNFMAFDDEHTLREVLEHHLVVGSATVDDVLMFCKNNKLIISKPMKARVEDIERRRNHDAIVYGRINAPLGVRKFFRLSNWRNIVRHVLSLWQIFLYQADWRIEFYFDSGILSEIYVTKILTSL